MSKKVLHWCIHSDTGDHSKQNINNIKIYTFKEKNKRFADQCGQLSVIVAHGLLSIEKFMYW